MNTTKNPNKLNGKDLMNIGIFTAVSVIIGIAVAITVGMIPIGFMMISSIGPIILGIPMMLYFTRIKKFGMILIMQIINGLVMILTGMGPDSLIYGTVLALLAELILRTGKYQSAGKAVFAYAVMGIGGSANYIHWINASAEWLEKSATSFGETYMYTIAGYFEYWWVFPVLVLLSFIGGLIGGVLGRAVLKKHFIKSGLL